MHNTDQHDNNSCSFKCGMCPTIPTFKIRIYRLKNLIQAAKIIFKYKSGCQHEYLNKIQVVTILKYNSGFKNDFFNTIKAGKMNSYIKFRF